MFIEIEVYCWLCGRLIKEDSPPEWNRKSDGEVIYSCSTCYHKAVYLQEHYHLGYQCIQKDISECRLTLTGGD